MNILLTGAFGNVGQSTLAALVERGHRVRCFDVPSKANQKIAARWQNRAEICWGDLRNPEDVCRAVEGFQAVLHLGFVIPTLSATGTSSEAKPEWARSINVGGSRNLIEAIQRQPRLPGQPYPPRLIFASSLHVYGKTQHLPPPRTASEIPQPVEHYAHHKVEVEGMLRDSGLDWGILRLGAALPIRLILDRGMFDVPLSNRIEFVHTRDAGLAFANAADHTGVTGRILLIGGGPACQLIYEDMMTQMLDAMGIGALPERAFSRVPFATDWLDTRESQDLLCFQQRTFSDYTKDLRAALGPLRGLILAARPLVRRWLLSQSPYYSNKYISG